MESILPKALVVSKDFAALSAEQQEQFAKRLAFTQDVLREASSWLKVQEGEFRDFADGLELDLTSAFAVDMSDTETQVSTWFVHSTWGFEVRAENLAGLLSDEIRGRLDENLPPLSTSKNEFAAWLAIEVQAVLAVLDSLRGAQSFDHVVAYLIAVDTLLGRLLTALFKWRLWVRVRR